MRVWKLTRSKQGSIRLRMEICENSCPPFSKVPRLHQGNVHIKRKLHTRRAQKCISLLGAKNTLASTGTQTTSFHGGSIGPKMEICENSGLPFTMVPRLHQSNVYIKRKLWVWSDQKYIPLVGGKPYLPVRVCKLPRFMQGSIMPRMEICINSSQPIGMIPCFY